MNKILLIEDDVAIARYLELELKHEGYALVIQDNGKSGLDCALEEDYDLILLDILLPEMSGLEVLRKIRKEKNTPIIMLTSKGEVSDKVAGLDSGANDYIAKPFFMEELLARIRVVFRKDETDNILQYGELQLHVSSRTVTIAGEEIQLTKREYDLLVYLLKNKNIVLSREKIIESVWGYDFYDNTNVVDVYIKSIRQKLEPLMPERMIQTVRGIGYVIKDKI
ncbi:DNA-binding response OmpR family regulator [Lacrimispora xylanisolvens]|jgi:DNA-binding response OmpR family regulator|uniref:Stage 0 sporulation protein A homolog n=1 Tax=Lacrimispora xylanisolvens TaxID=384636 RepID=A0A2S6HVG0_9FIRM|nr:response regulator transcription factor [Hungatella xylanolytica]MBE5989192.1 response regulator transcription factor [Paenibacillaceae bacterium]PPK81941.1 DNA-binding response OmpR family regulator [Hungatella xylanolytica]